MTSHKRRKWVLSGQAQLVVEVFGETREFSSTFKAVLSSTTRGEALKAYEESRSK